MRQLITKFTKCIFIGTLLLSTAALFAGCASQNAAKGTTAGENTLITDILTSEDDAATTVTIKGSQALTYTAIKQVFPLGVLFDFPETFLDNIKTVYYPPENDLISSIRSTRIEENGKASRIFIALKKDLPYNIQPEANELNIIFPKSGKLSAKARPKPKAKPAVKAVPKPASPATRIISVSATPHRKNVVVAVKADGTITDFKSFTIGETPPRIVYDIYKVKSPFKGEQRMAVKSDQVKKVRHFGHPDKIRIVLETNKAYLSKYTARSVDDGVLIYVGQAPPSKEKPKTVTSWTTKPKQASANGKTAWLNRIDFNSDEAGESTVIVGTTRPVKYKMIKVDNKRLNLKLMRTNLPEYRKQSLITTRFQSAVDRITPTFRPTSNDTVIDIELREGVRYSVKQTDDVIRVNFAASKIPPKPYEDAKLPAWKQTQGQPAAADSKAPMAGAAPATAPSAAKPMLVAARGKPATTTAVTAAAATTTAPAKTADKGGKQGTAEKATPSPRPSKTSGEVIYTETDPDRFDYESQMRLDPYSGEEKSLDVYGEKVVKKYTGEPIALDFYETDIKNVFRILKEISGKNFAVDKGVTGRVTLALEQPVPWDQVLDLVLKMNQLGRKMEGGIIRIATLSTLAAEELARRKKLGEAQLAKKQEDFVTAFIRVNYANAVTINDQHVAELLTPKESRMDEVGGESSVDDRLNMIVVTDVPSVIKRVKEIVQRLDQVTPQVLIEARIVEVNSSFTKDLGFDWGTVSAGPFDIGSSTLTLSGSANNIPTQISASGNIGFDFQKLTGTPFSIIDASLQVSETEGKSNIISAPKVVTLDNTKAKIKQGLEVPYLERDSSGNATVKFKNVDLLLEVTPNVTPDDRIVMKIFVTKNDVAEQTSDGPALFTNEAETELLIDNGDTVIIGGIVKSSMTYGEKGIPGLRQIGVLGWLFKGQSKEDTKNELLIFITPRIVRLQQKGNVNI